VFKRVRWLTVGALAGFSGSIWAQRRVRQAVERVMPAQLGDQVRRRVGRVSDDLLASLHEGRSAMAEREAELRARLPDGVTPLPGTRARGRVIDAVAVEEHPPGHPRHPGGRHPSDSSAPPGGSGADDTTVTELSAARRARPERRRRR
jgi:hypothetical protein